MKYNYDYDSDCAYIKVQNVPIAFSKEIDEARFVDYAKDGSVVGVELLYVSGGVDVAGLPMEKEISRVLEANKIKIFA